MFKLDAAEAKPIVQRAMKNLLLTVAEHGRNGSEARTAIGDLLATLDTLLHDDTLGEPLAECFDLARDAGATIQGIVVVYNGVAAETPSMLGGKLVKDALLNFCFANEARIIVDMTFRSREEVEHAKQRLNSSFAALENTVADAMDSLMYVALIRLHAATTHYLIETARPLPRMLAFRFAAPLSTLVAAHRLYDDAGRADELREENRVVHPAFMKPQGVALSA
jgi:prophage DNA circulation protein